MKRVKQKKVYRERVLVVVPHCDDEVLGFGGSIQKHQAMGNHVAVLFLRQAHDARTRHQAEGASKAQKILGYDQAEFLGIPDEEMGLMPPHILREVEEKIRKHRPTIVYTTFLGDIHQDHAGTFRAVRMGTRVLHLPGVRRLLLGEIASSTTQRVPTDPAFRPNHYEILSREMVRRKARALSVYDQEKVAWPHPRSEKGITVQAEYRGMEIGRPYAEAFMVLRQVWD